MEDETVPALETVNVKSNKNGVISVLVDNVKEDAYRKQQSPFKKQAIIAFGTFMLTVSAGATAGFSAVLIPQLQHGQGKEKKYSREMVSWVAAIASLALLFGNMISGYLMEKLGRRRCQLMLSFTFIIGWVIIAVASNISQILLGRFITGFSQGFLGPLGPVFVGEISTPIYRGFFLAAMSLAIAFGVLMSHLFGTLMHYSLASILLGIFPFIGGVLIFYAPETPAWLASMNRIEDCTKSFNWYRGTSPSGKVELDKIIQEQQKRDFSKNKLKTLSDNIKKPEFWKPLGIMMVFFLITQLSGVNVVCAYTTDMMEELIGNRGNSYVAMLSIDVLRCVSLLFACVLLRRLGRRPMALYSGIFTSLSLIILAVYLYLVRSHTVRHLSPIISLGLMALYMIVSNLGIVPLPWNMVGELFATETKGLGSGISVMITSMAFFGTVKTAPAMFHAIGYHGAYMFYGVSTFFGTVFLYFCLPETKGKTLLQIEENFRRGKKIPQTFQNDMAMAEK